jgi:hypothetical protein
MQDLPIGSLIAFGSTIDYKFCIDTVFVVGLVNPRRPTSHFTVELQSTGWAIFCTSQALGAITQAVR